MCKRKLHKFVNLFIIWFVPLTFIIFGCVGYFPASGETALELSQRTNEFINFNATLAQKTNALTGLLKMFTPTMLALVSPKVSQIHFNYATCETAFFCLILMYSSITSFLLHGFLVHDGVILDESGFVWVVAFLMAKTSEKFFYNFSWKASKVTFCVFFILVVVFYDPVIASLATQGTPNRRPLMFFLPNAIFTEIMYASHIEKRVLPNCWGMIAMCLFLLGCVFFWIEYNKFDIVDPKGLWQYHAAEQFTSGVSYFFYFMMYKKQEQRRNAAVQERYGAVSMAADDEEKEFL